MAKKQREIRKRRERLIERSFKVDREGTDLGLAFATSLLFLFLLSTCAIVGGRQEDREGGRQGGRQGRRERGDGLRGGGIGGR